tara:strand:+ start:1172 stop:1426 length:255 start_codon:yes stop_codon:yes gene_type:complete
MKHLLLLMPAFIFIGLGSVQADSGQENYTAEQIKEMPRYSSIENQRCPSAKYPSVNKRLQCKKEVRIELYEKRKERELSVNNKD